MDTSHTDPAARLSRPWLTTEQVAEQLHRSPDTIRRWVRIGRLVAHRPVPGGPMLIHPDDVDDLIEQVRVSR